jgi:hypothetical protein
VSLHFDDMIEDFLAIALPYHSERGIGGVRRLQRAKRK